MAGKKILVVEDNAIIAMETVERLKRLGCSICGVAATGADAVRLAGSQDPDLILMDINLKGDMDGIEAAETITQARPVPIIYLTAYSDEETLARARAGGPCRYLVKPYKERALYAAIEEALCTQPYRDMPEISDELQRFITNLETFDDGIFITGDRGDLRYLNRQAVAITRWSPGAVIGKPLDSILISDSPGPQRNNSGPLRCNPPHDPCTIISPGGMRIAARHFRIPLYHVDDGGKALLIFWEAEDGGV